MKKFVFSCLLLIFFLMPNLANAAIWPLQVGQVWEYLVTDSRDPNNPWNIDLHIGDIVEINSYDLYSIASYDHKTEEWESGIVFVNSDDNNVYIVDEEVFKILPLSSMTPQHVVVPYGEFDAYYYDEGDWYNYFAPGVGHLGWFQIEDDYTVTAQLVNIVPIPEAAWLLGTGLAGLVGIRTRRRKKQ